MRPNLSVQFLLDLSREDIRRALTTGLQRKSTCRGALAHNPVMSLLIPIHCVIWFIQYVLISVQHKKTAVFCFLNPEESLKSFSQFSSEYGILDCSKTTLFRGKDNMILHLFYKDVIEYACRAEVSQDRRRELS